MSLALNEARLGKAAHPSLVEAMYEPLIAQDIEMFDAYLAVDLAHVIMLSDRGIIGSDPARALVGVLSQLRSDGPASIKIDASFGGFLLQVERHIASVSGQDAAGMLQLGRSRIDQNAAVARVYARNSLISVMNQLVDLQGVVLDRAREWKAVIMPGYTHLQHAQPWVLGHYLLGQHDVFQRDFQRLVGVYGRTNLGSLGGVALSGTSWPIDRRYTAELLGHAGIVRNSKDAGNFVMDHQPELAAMLSILMSALGRLASELYIWSSWEFGLVELDESLCGTSSIMPQKKNPYALERIRALAGEAIGWLPGQLGLFKTPTTSDCDRSFSSGITPCFKATRWGLLLMSEALRTMRIDENRMRERAGAFWSTASNLADLIVRERGLDFRRAHHVVGALVKTAVADGLRPSDVGAAEVDAAAKAVLSRSLDFTDEQISTALNSAEFVATRVSEGSIGPKEIEKQLDLAMEDHAAARSWMEEERARLSAAEDRLAAAASRIVAAA